MTTHIMEKQLKPYKRLSAFDDESLLKHVNHNLNLSLHTHVLCILQWQYTGAFKLIKKFQKT